MSDPILGGVEAVAGTFKDLVVARIGEYLRFINSYKENMTELRAELKDLCAKKLDLDENVTEGKKKQEVMTRQTADWLEKVVTVIKGSTMKKLMKEEGIAEIVVKVMEPRALKNLWQEDRELFVIVINAVKKKGSHRKAGDREVFRAEERDRVASEEGDREIFRAEEHDREASEEGDREASEEGDREVFHAEEDADYKKVAKVVSDVMKDIAMECAKLIQSNDGAVAVVKLLDDKNLKTLTKDDNETAMILSKAEDVIRKNIEHHDHDEEELLPPKNNEYVQPVDKSITKENVGRWCKHIRSLMSFWHDENFMDDENIKKSLPDGAKVGLEIMVALSKSSGSEQFETNNGKPHRYCGCWGLHFKVYRHRHDMSQIAEIMVKDIKSLTAKYPLGSVTKVKKDNGLDYTSGEFVEGLESRELLLRMLLNVLKYDQDIIVGVYGMSGCGKTTLVKEIARRRARDLFDKSVVVEVSKTPNIKGIQNQIATGIGLTLNDTHTLAQRARIIYNKLKEENILIILENIWKKLKLDEVGIFQEGTEDLCCKVLITTREEKVCTLMNVPKAKIFKVYLLNEREALNLFEYQTNMKVNRGEFKPVADKLLRKCGGLPLPIVMTASALRGRNLPMWCNFAEISEMTIPRQVSIEYRETCSILETSYKFIDIEENKKFLFLACLSPLDSAVMIDDLMRYGIGLDLFQRFNGLFEAMEQASTWANELLSSSLLLKGVYDGEVRIHDLVRASFISFIDKGKDHMTLVESIPRWMCTETFEKFTAISLMSGHDFSRLSGVKAPMLQILLLKGDVSLTTLNSDFFGGMKNMKVLSLSNMNFDLGLPETMGELERLQTMHLHHCKLKDIKLIGKLVNLLVLSLRESSLTELAVEIGELCNLRLLDVGGCKGVKSIPANILSRLSNLEGFYTINGFDGWASTNIEADDGEGYKQASGSELDLLSHLNVLEMEVSDIKQLLTVSNSQLVEQLSKFKIRVRNSYDWNMAEVSAFRYVLELKDIDASQNNWLRALLRKSESLLVMDCDRLTENIVPQLDEDGLKDLKHLHVQNCNVKFIVSSNEHDQSVTFANLELLRLASMNRLEMICDGKAPRGMFSNLRRLFLSGLTKLESGLVLTLVPLNLSEVSVEACVSLKFIFMKDASVQENETDIVLFPLLKSLHLKHVGRLSSVVGQSHTVEHTSVDCHVLFAKGIFPSLESLKLQENRVIVTLWSKACDVSSLQNLKVLHISECNELTSLGSPSIFSALVQLEELTISRCAKLQQVITKETEEHKVRKHVICFPQLKRLSLENCFELEMFYGGSYKLRFIWLKSLKLSCAPKLTTFDGTEHSTAFFSDKIEFPHLEELEVQRVSEDVVRLWNGSTFNPAPMLLKLSIGYVHGLMSMPSVVSFHLSHLEVMGFDDIKSLFCILPVNRENFWTNSQFWYLENLHVQSCKFLEQLFENEDDNDTAVLCENITGIMLKENPNLKMLPLHLLKNIRTLALCDLSWEYVFPGDLFKKGREQLQQLENLDIRKCKNIQVIILDELDGNGEDKVYSFPRLKSLTLEWLDVTNFSSKPNTRLLLPSLESIQLSHLYEIKSFYSGPFTARKLKEVKIEVCGRMEYFLSENISEVRELPSLESVHIRTCSNMMAFAYAPLIAPKLHHVTLDNCSKMEWFLHGDPNLDDILDLPSLESVSIIWCDGMQSFSSGGIKAPNLCELEVNNKDYIKCANEELQDLLVNLAKCRTAA